MAEAVLTIQMENLGGTQIVRVSGPLDSVTHDQFKNTLDPLVQQAHVRLVLDCEGLTYVNSKGLALFGRYQRVCAQGMAFFGIAALGKRIVKTMELLGLSRIVKLYGTVEEACAAAEKLT